VEGGAEMVPPWYLVWIGAQGLLRARAHLVPLRDPMVSGARLVGMGMVALWLQLVHTVRQPSEGLYVEI